MSNPSVLPQVKNMTATFYLDLVKVVSNGRLVINGVETPIEVVDHMTPRPPASDPVVRELEELRVKYMELSEFVDQKTDPAIKKVFQFTDWLKTQEAAGYHGCLVCFCTETGAILDASKTASTKFLATYQRRKNSTFIGYVPKR